MGDSVIEEAMMASSLMDGSIIDDNYDAYADMSSFSANLCDVVQDDDIEIYDTTEESEYINKSRRLMCKRCGKSFRNKLLLKKHLAMHSKEPVFDCEQCDKKFSRKESLNRHQLVHSGMKFFECPECGRMFNQNGHLRTHMLVHTKEKNFECETCNMKFARKDNMKRHALLHEKRKAFECHVCGKKFHQHGHLESHMVVHTQEKNYECQECSMKFARRDTLKRHMLVHSKEKTYECDSCLAKFIQNSHLKAHLLVHTKEKKFRCNDCDKKFARKGSLKRHRLVHTGERNFECTECGKTFIQKTHLNKHLLIHSGGGKSKVKNENNGEAFMDNVNKVEVHIQHMNSTKSAIGNVAAPVKQRANTTNKAGAKSLSTKNADSPGTKTDDLEASKTNSLLGQQTTSSSKGISQTTCVSAAQQLNSQHIVGNGMQPCPTQTYKSTGNVAAKGGNPENQSNNLLANSNSVMALAFLDHFLTGNESQDNIAAQEAAAKAKNGNNQWGQKTHQELLAAQTLSAFGQRGSVPAENHQMYGQVPFVTPQVSACNMQPMSQGVLTSGSSVMKIRPPTNTQWMPQEKTIMHPQNVVYNVPPPAHEIFRYYAPTSMPLPHPSNRPPDGSCIPADMRASPRKPKYPQKVVLPPGEWQATLPVHPGTMNPNIPVYAHAKHPSEIPHMLNKP